MDPVFSYLFKVLIPLVMRTLLFVAVFRFRRKRVSLITSFLLAAAPMFLAFIPIPLPGSMAWILGIGITLLLLNKYTEIDVLPEGIVIVLAVEAASWIFENLLTILFF